MAGGQAATKDKPAKPAARAPAPSVAKLPMALPVERRPVGDEEPLIDMAGAFQATATGLTSWAMNAGPDRVCVYARVTRLSRGGVGERARALHAAGLVALLPQRPVKEAPGLFDYRVRRTAAPYRGLAAPVDEAGLRPEERLLLDLLVETADAGERCPTNRDLAALLGLKREEQVTRMLGRLTVTGHVRVTFTDAVPPVRVVTILATGKATFEDVRK